MQPVVSFAAPSKYSWRDVVNRVANEIGYGRVEARTRTMEALIERGAQPSSPNARTSPAQEGPSRIHGQVKWFDFAKGYGFIAPSDGGADILLHQICVRQSGFKLVKEGAAVVCETVRGPRGLQACRLVSLDNSTAHPMASPSAREQYPVSEPRGRWHEGSVKWFNRAKGYGFRALSNCARARKYASGSARGQKANWRRRWS